MAWRGCLWEGQIWYNKGTMRSRWTLFTAMGIPVRADLSVLVLAVYVVFSTLPHVGVGLFLTAALLVSILLHELAHSAVAVAFGGQVRDITLQLLGGCAMITRMPPRPSHEVLMAAAGPVCSLALAALCWTLAGAFPTRVVVGTLGPYEVTKSAPNPWLGLAAGLNLGLALFNLVPAFPMDGGRILRAGLQCLGRAKVAATEIAVRVGQGFAVLWAVICVLDFAGVRFHAPAGWPWALQLIFDIVFGSGGILLLLIAYMIWVSGKRELEYVRYEETYGGWR